MASAYDTGTPALTAQQRQQQRSHHIEQVLKTLGAQPLVMGILNVTPDSFSDGGQFNSHASALKQAHRLVRQGADILDIGGESTRPGATEVGADDELARVAPVISSIASMLDVPISIDTYKARVADEAMILGASIINDVWGLQRDPDMATVAADHGALVVAMHNRDTVDPNLDIMSDIARSFERSVRIARRAGIPDDRLILDPGIGFGKDFDQNLTIVANLDVLRGFGFPLLMGLSRKRFLGAITGAPAEERVIETMTANLWSLMHGANIVRVHDVGEHVAARTALKGFATGD